jgi:hypothetical protein
MTQENMAVTKTTSEILFERFLSTNNIAFQPIATGLQNTPDYVVTVGGVELFFEVKEFAEDSNFVTEALHSRRVGQGIRKKVSDQRAMKQIQSASKKGKPTVLLLYNNLDPLQLHGTENHDFEHAMYGELTVVIDPINRAIVDSFHGKNKLFQEGKNTSFSALGRLRKRPFSADESLDVTLFENIHAKVPVDYDALPACFKVVRAERLVI